MKEKLFSNGNAKDGRLILIRISSEYIEFFFKEYFDRKNKWIDEEKERREQSGEPELTDDELGNHSFYWTWVDDWKNPKKNWESHMLMKVWFTQKMLDFINENIFYAQKTHKS